MLSLIELFNETLINDLPLGIVTLTTTFQVSMMNWSAHKILDIREKETRSWDLSKLLCMMKVSRAAEIERRIKGRERFSWGKLKLPNEKYIKLKTFPS